MKKRYICLFSLLCLGYAQSICGMIESIKVLRNKGKKVVLIEYDPNRSLPLAGSKYFEYFNNIANSCVEQNQSRKKKEFFAFGPLCLYLLDENLSFKKNPNSTSVCDLFYLLSDNLSKAIELLRNSTFSGGVLIKDSNIIKKITLSNQFEIDTGNIGVIRGLNNIGFFRENISKINKVLTLACGNKVSPKIEDILNSLKLLTNLFTHFNVKDEESIISFIIKLSEAIKDGQVQLPQDSFDWIDKKIPKDRAFLNYIFSCFDTSMQLCSTLESQNKKDVVTVCFVSPSSSVKFVIGELKLLGYKGDDVKDDFIPKDLRSESPYVFKMLLNRILLHCNICGKECRSQCSTCGSACYCSDECKEKDSKRHKNVCLKLREEREKERLKNESGENFCDSCGQPAKKCCQQCSSVYYCSRLCQKEDWSEHKKTCKK